MSESETHFTAIVVGATGAIGADLVAQLENDARFDSVEVFVRREVKLENPKFHVHVIDFDKPETWTNLVQGDVLFSCLGTTKKAAGSQEAQWKVDHDYQYEFAKAAANNGVKRYILISSVGASKDSSFFYLKLKGTLDDEVQQMSFQKVVILRPPSLIRKNSDRFGENFGVKALKAFNAIGMFRGSKPMKTEDVATAMRNVAASTEETPKIITGQEILKFSQ